jgi:hypothetical protein
MGRAGKILGGCLGVVALVVVIAVVASLGGSSDKPSETAVVSAQPTADSAGGAPAKDDKSAGDKAADAPAKKPGAKKAQEFKDGDYVVGEDIPAGTYATDGAQKGVFEFCAITTKPADSATLPQIKSADADQRIIITLTKADGVVTINGCEPLKPRK